MVRAEALSYRPGMTLKIYFDGGCRPNPGRLAIAVVARGATYFQHDLGEGDNNDAEWRALLHALGIARSLGATDLAFLGDSAMVVDQANGAASVPARFTPYLAEFKTLAAGFDHLRVRRIGRGQNLAGIALDRLHGRR